MANREVDGGEPTYPTVSKAHLQVSIGFLWLNIFTG